MSLLEDSIEVVKQDEGVMIVKLTDEGAGIPSDDCLHFILKDKWGLGSWSVRDSVENEDGSLTVTLTPFKLW